MKLEDIKKSLEHAVTIELQRAIYNGAGVVSRDELAKVFAETIQDIYEDDSDLLSSGTHSVCE